MNITITVNALTILRDLDDSVGKEIAINYRQDAYLILSLNSSLFLIISKLGSIGDCSMFWERKLKIQQI